MNFCTINQCKYQNGAASLLTSIVLLIAITLVVFASAKTILNETKISADQYRTAQATAAAQYAMDVGLNYFDTGGFDRLDEGLDASCANGSLVSAGNAAVLGNDGCLDSMADIDGDGVFDDSFSNLTLTSSDGSQVTSATLSFVNNVCGGDGSNMRDGQITATGFSDDGLATRTITQCVGPLGILRNDGPKQPLVAQGNVALTGNARIINRFTNTTIWSGDKVTIGSSSAMETYIKNPDSLYSNLDMNDAADQAILLSTDEDVATQLISNNNLGNGMDVIDDDPSLGTLVGLEFFQNFFTIETRQQLKNLAGNQAYADIASAIASPPKSGLFWIGEDNGGTAISMTGGQIGTLNSPAIVYINGDFSLGGNAVIYGLLYVGGKYTIVGTPTVVGANIVEGTNLTTETQATAPIVSGTGTISLVYWPGFAKGSSNPLPGLSAVVSGSWRDW